MKTLMSSYGMHSVDLTLEALRGGGGQIDPPLDFFGLKFLLLDQLSKALASCSLFVNTSFDTN